MNISRLRRHSSVLHSSIKVTRPIILTVITTRVQPFLLVAVVWIGNPFSLGTILTRFFSLNFSGIVSSFALSLARFCFQSIAYTIELNYVVTLCLAHEAHVFVQHLIYYCLDLSFISWVWIGTVTETSYLKYSSSVIPTFLQWLSDLIAKLL